MDRTQIKQEIQQLREESIREVKKLEAAFHNLLSSNRATPEAVSGLAEQARLNIDAAAARSGVAPGGTASRTPAAGGVPPTATSGSSNAGSSANANAGGVDSTGGSVGGSTGGSTGNSTNANAGGVDSTGGSGR